MRGPAAGGARRLHVAEYVSEFVETLFLLVCVVGSVALLFAPALPVAGALPPRPLRWGLDGLLIGLASWLVAASPLGRLSGGHVNPAVSLGFWVLRKMHVHDLAGYIAAQLLGAVAGAWIGVHLFGSALADVHDATLRAGDGVPAPGAFAAELGGTFALTSAIYTFVSHPSLQPFTPAMMTVVYVLLETMDGDYSGCGLSPSRWLGPAAVRPDWGFWWVYLAGPLLGAAGAALVRCSPLVRAHTPLTGKIVHDARYRSIFKHDRLPSQSRDGRPRDGRRSAPRDPS